MCHTGYAYSETRLVVGYEENPPIASTNANGVPEGVSIDLLNYMAKQAGWNIQWKSCKWERCLKRLASGEIDLLVGMGHTREREQQYSFTVEPVMVNWGQLYTAKNRSVSTMLDLEGKRIALVTTDSHGQAFIEMLRRFNVNTHIKPADSYRAALQDVTSGKADACVISRIFPLSHSELDQINQTPIIFNPVQNKYATAKGKNQEILQEIDRQLLQLKADKSSFYYRNLEAWLGVPGSRSVSVWVWWAIGGGTFLCGMALVLWRYRSVVKLSNELSISKLNLHTVFDNTDKGIVIHDPQGRIIAVNRPATALFGSDESTLVGLNVVDLSAETEEKNCQLPDLMRKVIDGQTLKIDWKCLNLNTKTSFDAEIIYACIVWNGKVVLMGMVQDVTQIKQKEALIRRLTIAVEQSANTVVITDKQGIIQYANPSFERMTGYSVNEALGQNPRVLKSGVHPPIFYKKLWSKLMTGEVWQGHFCNKHKNGELFWESTTITPVRQENLEITHFVAIKEDITVRKRHEEMLYRQANFDDLTALPNRNLLTQRVIDLIADKSRRSGQVVLMLLDLDNFKMINDTLGHSLGDKLLCKVAERLSTCVAPDDMVARLGGDEFAIVPANISDNAASVEQLAEQIMQSFSTPFSLQGQEVFITASMGIVTHPEDGEGMETLLRNADAAMYHSKNRGRNSYEFYRRELNGKSHERLVMETQLRRALERNEFVVYYQPQQDLMTGQVHAFEALLRWEPEAGTIISPADFIPILEETGLIIDVGEWVLQEVCNQVKQWNSVNVSIKHASVNISFRQFQRPDIVERLLSIIRNSGVSPACICLELTESIMMDNPEDTLQKLDELRNSGLSLSIDDFGTGYSSLAYLRRMPLNELKIDRSFIMTLPESNAGLVNTILGMARSFEMRVVAEGVENLEQLEYLQQHGCEIAQGYFISRPMPADQFELFMRKYNSHRLIANELLTSEYYIVGE